MDAPVNMSKSTSVPYDIEIHYVLCYCVYCNIAVMIVIYISVLSYYCNFACNKLPARPLFLDKCIRHFLIFYGTGGGLNSVSAFWFIPVWLMRD